MLLCGENILCICRSQQQVWLVPSTEYKWSVTKWNVNKCLLALSCLCGEEKSYKACTPGCLIYTCGLFAHRHLNSVKCSEPGELSTHVYREPHHTAYDLVVWKHFFSSRTVFWLMQTVDLQFITKDWSSCWWNSLSISTSCKGGDGFISKTFFGSRLLVKLTILNVNSAPFCYALTFFFSPPYFAFALQYWSSEQRLWL